MNKWPRLITLCLLAILTLGASIIYGRQTAEADTNSSTAGTPDLLAIYALSFDNPADADNSLAPLMGETLALLGAVTAENPAIRVAILADGGNNNDTILLTAQGGITTNWSGLPDKEGNLDLSLTEFNMTDGVELGGFLLWARSQFPTSLTTFTYLGHGLPVTPWLDAPLTSYSQDPYDEDGNMTRSGSLNPLPLRWCLNGSGTDHHVNDVDPDAFSMITPHAIGEALRIGSNDGASPFDVFDSMHCFAQSVEQLYEVAGDDNHDNLYVRATVGSPSYAYFAPELLPKVLEDLTVDAATTYNSIATQMVNSYHGLHEPANTHPHLIAAVDNSGLEAIKSNWTTVGERLVAQSQTDPATTWARVLSAYNSSEKYDTSICEGEQDYALTSPDALVSFQQFAEAIRNEYAVDPIATRDQVLVDAANDVFFGMAATMITERGSDGTPHFGDAGAQNWELSSLAPSSYDGISLFTPLLSQVVSGTTYMPWQSLWYTQDTTILAGGQSIPNPKPLRFFDTTGDNWQSFLAAYWAANSLVPGVDVETIFCTSELPDFSRAYADLRVEITESSDPAPTNSTATYDVTVTNGGNLIARNVVLDVRVQAALTFLESSPPENCLAGEPLCTLQFGLDSIDVDESKSVTIKAQTPATTERSGTVTASVSSVSREGLEFNNSAEEETQFSVPTVVTGINAESDRLPGGIVLLASLLLFVMVTTVVIRRTTA